MEQFKFRVLKQDHKTQARIGEIQTSHGKVDTPAFVPVGTQATVKTLTPEELNTLGVQLFFVNTYHTYLRPGVAVIKKFGGLHRFMGWNGPIITDSGGFQIFSLARNFNRQPPPDGPEVGPADAYRGSFFDSPRQGPDLPSVHQRPFAKAVTGLEKTRRAASSSSFVKITEEGVEFRSHWDGSLHQFTPEKSIEIQHALGADIILAFDDCTPYPVTYEKARISMERTHRWAERSFVTNAKCQMLNAKFKKPYQALYGVIQGSVYEDLRKESAKFISSLPFVGIAIGGVSVGESKEEMAKVLKWVTPILPSDRPRHLLGVGEIDDIFTLVEAGIDTFDCVAPTRLGRMGHLYTNSKF
ncbi:MAG: tRNA guanosine(34) transglycosylase Tgt, partial [Patescibacteria group bacterium]